VRESKGSTVTVNVVTEPKSGFYVSLGIIYNMINDIVF
jgi:hypothetical protein